MTGPDTAASAELGKSDIKPCWVGWLDFDGDPVRVTTAPYNVTFSGTGDPELDGFTFHAVSEEVLGISEVGHLESGSDTVTATLSGLVGINTDLLNILGDASLWRGNAVALWLMLYDTNLQRVGNIWRYYTGTMVSAPIKGSPKQQTIEALIESYLASLTRASNRTYLDQERYDPGDHSAAASIAVGNGTASAGSLFGGASGGFGGYGGGDGRLEKFNSLSFR